MQYESDRANDTSGEPSIAEMTKKAIQILSKNNNGFFLAVEGIYYEDKLVIIRMFLSIKLKLTIT